MPRVLLVEDNEANRDMLSRRLQRSGWQVIGAGDGREGIAQALRSNPDVILMDMSLPLLNGLEATRVLKADARTCRIPIIALTAHVTDMDRDQAMLAGCCHFESKPVDYPRLLRTMTDVIEHRRQMPRAARILIVDDEEMNLDMFSRRLERSGFAVQVAATGLRSLEIVMQGDVDLVLLDQMMPGMSGTEVLQTIRRQRTAQELPVIMLTAVVDGARVAEALDMGANDYITKPVDFPVALARIRSQISRSQAESALRLSEERYSLAARGAKDGLWDWDLMLGQIYYSARWKQMLGCEESEIGTSPEEWFSRVHADDRDLLDRSMDLRCQGKCEDFQCVYRMRHRDGSYRWMSVRGMVLRSPDGDAVRAAGSQTDITDQHTIDELTGLPNRLFFTEHLAGAIRGQREQSAGNFAVFFLDLDRFKLVNDSLGHLWGDRLLIEVAGRLREVLRTMKCSGGHPALIARFGGDEFALLAEKLPSAEGAEEIGASILKAMRPPFLLDGREIFCSLSAGISMSSPQYDSAEEMIRDADTAMSAAKARGKGRWVTFEPRMHNLPRLRLQMDSDLRLALTRSEFEVYYQPRVELSSRLICGFEALIRWNHPTRGLVNPTEFIPIAEEIGLMNEIGMWVLRQACTQMLLWHQRYPRYPSLDIAVNVSACQCREPDLLEQIATILRETRLPPSSLHLELTESMLLENMNEAQRLLLALKGLGIGLKIDDFGTGYSCLKYLCQLPFDSLKIDRSFTSDLDANNPDSEEMIRTIILMARNLKMEVIAEGVEKDDQLRQLRGMGCEVGQGFLFSRPVNAQATEMLLEADTRIRESIPGRARVLTGIAP